MMDFFYIENQIKSSIENNEKMMKKLEDSIDNEVNTIKNIYAMCELQKANNDSLKLLKELYVDVEKIERLKEGIDDNTGVGMKSIMELISNNNAST